ncbi:MAG: methionyl-tRNA formyltransferase [Gammaproteobacteria bacterium]|nr:methionyl-tRNA formyltransferase [Gammaproteobacteria bacterium]
MNGRVVLAGSPAFATPTLQRLADLGHLPVAVLTQPDRPAGRGRTVAPGPVKQLALALGIPVLQPSSLKTDVAQAELRALAPDLIVVVAYGLLLPAAVLALPRRGCVNVHASLLPRWRGASPIQAAILAGDAETGVSIMQLEAGLDLGPVYATARLTIGSDETAAELEARLALLGADTLATLLEPLLAGQLTPTPQPDAGVTYAGRINKAEARIDWQTPAAELARRVRAFSSWPVAETLLDGQQLRCFASEPAADGRAVDGVPGTIVATDNGGILVQTGRGQLWLRTVQLSGRQRVAGADFARGRALVGKVLG